MKVINFINLGPLVLKVGTLLLVINLVFSISLYNIVISWVDLD